MLKHTTLYILLSFLELFPLEFHSDCSTSPLGVSNPDVIPDSHMTASSEVASPESRFQPAFGRLGGNRGEGWCSLTPAGNNDWLQIYFGDMFTVCRVDTQGDINGNEWVTDFKLSFSSDGNSWTTYNHNGTELVRHSCILNFVHDVFITHRYQQ